MTAYYNEIDPYAAQWLRNLIDAGHIAPGIVDERSIEDVHPSDLIGYDQCHFFAGIGVWSHALRSAGWDDDRPVWTGSCPCQPFSAAGKGAGTSDLRHLWPAWHHLIRECRPTVIFGEQVEAAIAHGWLDLVHTDLEAEGYAFGAVGLPAAGIGAPHIRQRLWFVAHAGCKCKQSDRLDVGSAPCSACRQVREQRIRADLGTGSVTDILADTSVIRNRDGKGLPEGCARPGESNGNGTSWGRFVPWLCRDGKRRPVEPGIEPLVDGDTEVLGPLRAYGNSIVAPLTTAFIKATLKETP